MPFSVQPSNSVVISGESITTDDFLKIILEDGEVLYMRSYYGMHSAYSVNYTFDQEFLPEGLAKEIKRIVDEWYKTFYVKFKSNRLRIREKHGHLFRMKGGLRGQLFSHLSSTFYVYNGSDGYRLDRGYKVRVHAHCLTGDGDIFDASYPSSGHYRNSHWTFSAPIVAILATDRAVIRKELEDKK